MFFTGLMVIVTGMAQSSSAKSKWIFMGYVIETEGPGKLMLNWSRALYLVDMCNVFFGSPEHEEHGSFHTVSPLI